MRFPRLEPRVCPVCGSTFQPAQNKVATCSDECGYTYRKTRMAERKAARRAGFPAPVPAPEPVTPCNTPLPLNNAPANSATLNSGPVAAPFPEAEPRAWTIPDPPAPTGNTGRYRRVLFWPDTHLPFADPKAVSLALAVLKFWRPDLLIVLGDMLDMAGFSRFPHDPVDRRMHFQSEIEEWRSLGQTILEASPATTERRFIRGNHERRMEKWLWGQPHLISWDGFNLGGLLKLPDFGFEPNVTDTLDLCNGTLTVKHGTSTGGNFAGTAARQEMARAGTSGVSGHTHRLAAYYQRDKAGLRVWIESGHLALNPQHYLEDLANWQQGVTVGEIAADGNDFWLEPVPFRLSYRCRVGGVELVA